MKKNTIKVLIAMGSQTDMKVMKEACDALDELGISHQTQILSAHRTPKEVTLAAEKAYINGFRVIIAGAGGAAHLPGMLAAHTALPVIGVPVPIGTLQGHDALLSIVQMPKGVPVATVAIGNAWNAGVLAAQILAVSEPALYQKLEAYKEEMRQRVVVNQPKSKRKP